MLANIKSRVTDAAVLQANDQLPGWVPNSSIKDMVGPRVSAKIDTAIADKLKGGTFAQALELGWPA
jgi:hypothetical protein